MSAGGTVLLLTRVSNSQVRDGRSLTVASVGRKVDVDDLVGAAEIAGRLGVARQVIHQWRQRHPDFPAPVLELDRAHVWHWPDVEAWARKTGRL